MRRSAPVRVIVLAAALSWAGAASAQESPDPQEQLSAIGEEIRSARFGEALTELDSLLDRDDLEAAVHNRALELRVIALLARRQTEDAERTLDELYARDPGHRLSDAGASPIVQQAFVRAAARAEPLVVDVVHEPPGELARGDDPVITLRIDEHRDAVQEVRVAHRDGGRGWARILVDLGPDGRAQTTLPITASTEGETRARYYIEALAPSGTVLGRAGSEDEPLELVVPKREQVLVDAETTGGLLSTGSEPARSDDGGIATSPWFWIAIAAVVVAGLAVGAYFLFGPPSQGPNEGDLGSIMLMPSP